MEKDNIGLCVKSYTVNIFVQISFDLTDCCMHVMVIAQQRVPSQVLSFASTEFLHLSGNCLNFVILSGPEQLNTESEWVYFPVSHGQPW